MDEMVSEFYYESREKVSRGFRGLTQIFLSALSAKSAAEI